MHAKQIDQMLGQVNSWVHAENTAARKAFCGAMKGRQYGFDPLLSAWSWFLDGWWMGSDELRSAQEPEAAP